MPFQFGTNWSRLILGFGVGILFAGLQTIRARDLMMASVAHLGRQ
jgi:hypothetical protein